MWLASSGDRAIADAEKAPAISKTLTRSVDAPAIVAGNTISKVSFTETEGLVQRLSVYVNVVTSDARGLRVYLTSPSGMKVLIVDGARSNALKKGGLEGWFGADGLQTAESLAAFTGEPVHGDWRLTIDTKNPGKLTKWSLTADVGSNASLAGLETYGEYDGGGGGCDCRVISSTGIAGGLLSSLLLLGLVLIRRRD
jgi:subtilisin-like proprotein convertase family protein